MSILEPQVIIVCDECGEELQTEVQSHKLARERATALGWIVGLKPTVWSPSLYDNKTDFCPNCGSGS